MRDGYDEPVWIMDAAAASGEEMVAGTATLGEWQVHTFTFDDANSSHRINGVEVATGDAGSNWMSNLGALWSTDGGWHRAADIDFGEGIFYDEVITGDDLTTLEQYLFDKWVVTDAVAGDFDKNGVVDGNDFLAWQANFGLTEGATQAQGDADGNGTVDGNDFLVWQANFGAGAGGGSAAVPEPTSAVVAGLCLLGGMLSLRRRR